ncbi:MAG TPA: tetratricopeptide repeat protein [Methylomirabilota bacterium]|jgi:Flp pilus assembly protein TadD
MLDRTISILTAAVAVDTESAPSDRVRVSPLTQYLLPAALAVLAFLVFAPALWNGFVEWDDDVNLLRNTQYRGLGWAQLRWMLTTILMGHYIPLTWFTFGLDFTMWGMDPFGYHLTNLILHAANTALVYLVARRLLSRATSLREPRLGIAAATASVFFAVHPLRVESVVWVTERRDVLSGFFFLLAVLTYLVSTDHTGGRKRWFLAAGAASFALALVSKSITMTLPLVLVLLDVYPLRRLGGDQGWTGPRARLVWIEKLPFFVLGAAGAAVSYYAVYANAFLTPLTRYPLPARIAMTLYSVAFYVAKTALPLGLSPMYELPAHLDPWELRFVASALFVMLVSTVTLVLWKRSPAGLAVWLYYGIVLGPVTGFIHSGHQLAHDRYSYLSCLGWALLVGGTVGVVLRATARRRVRPFFAVLAGVAGIVWLVGLAFLTVRQNEAWRDTERLWLYALQADPTCAVCHSNLGAYLVNQNMVEPALQHLHRTIELRPERLKTHGNIGLALLKLGRVEEAIPRFRLALEEDPYDVGFLTNLSVALMRQGRTAEALPYLGRALERDPGHILARTNLGTALAKLGQRSEALKQYRLALAIDADAPPPHLGLATLYRESGDMASARREYETLRALKSPLAEQISPAFIEEW